MEEDKKLTLVWTAPECPFRVTILADILNELRILAVEAFYSVPRGGVEIGGVLFGRRDGTSIHIQAHRQIRCEYSTGPSFTLSVKDQLGLSGLLDLAPSDPDLAGLTPLGWYHSHTRSEILLSPADLQLYSEFFPEKYQVALVIRPTNLQPTRAGFFFRDRRGNVKSDGLVQEFKLEPPDFGLPALEPADIPTASHQEAVAEVLPAVPDGPAPAAAEPPAEVTAPETGPFAPEEIPVAIAATAAAGSPIAPVPAPVVTTVEAPSTPPTDLVGIPSFDLAAAAAVKSRRTGWIWAAIFLVLLGVGCAAFLEWGRVGVPATLGLETYDINGAFLIRWDRNSPAIRHASRATLEIEDGGEKVEPISLTTEELSAGGYPYMRHTAQVSVRMTIEGPAPLEEFTNFGPAQALGSQPLQGNQPPALLAQALQEKQHLTTELINESMQTAELRREIISLRRQLAEERARNTPTPDR